MFNEIYVLMKTVVDLCTLFTDRAGLYVFYMYLWLRLGIVPR
jgi:hypothetical protein